MKRMQTDQMANRDRRDGRGGGCCGRCGRCGRRGGGLAGRAVRSFDADITSPVLTNTFYTRTTLSLVLLVHAYRYVPMLHKTCHVPSWKLYLYSI